MWVFCVVCEEEKEEKKKNTKRFFPVLDTAVAEEMSMLEYLRLGVQSLTPPTNGSLSAYYCPGGQRKTPSLFPLPSVPPTIHRAGGRPALGNAPAISRRGPWGNRSNNIGAWSSLTSSSDLLMPVSSPPPDCFILSLFPKVPSARAVITLLKKT